MNDIKYNVMEDVVPKLTESEMAHMASGGSKGVSKFFGSLVEDTLGEVEWRKLMDEFLEKNVGSFIKKYVDNSSIDPYWFKKHDWHPLTKEKELIWEMPEGVTKKEDIFWDQDLISERFGKPKRTSSGAWRGDPHVSGWGGVQEFLDNYKGEFGDIEWQKNFGKMYEKVPYNEFDAFGDTIEQMLHKIFGDEMAPTGEKFFTDMTTIMETLRKQLDEVKLWQAAYDTSPPQYKADQAYMLQHPKEQLNKTLKLIKDAISKKENAPYHPFDDPPGKISMNSRGGLHGYAAGGKVGQYFIREPVKAVGKFLKDNIPPVFSKVAEIVPKIEGVKGKLSSIFNKDKNVWEVGTIYGDRKIKVKDKWVKNPDLKFDVIDSFKNQASANRFIKKQQKQASQTLGAPKLPEKTEGALYWKSRKAIEDAPFETAPKKNWLDYLISRNIGYKELGDTSLLVTKTGVGEDGKPIKIPEGGFLFGDDTGRISKNDFLKEFDEIVPKIKVHLLGNRNFFDGLQHLERTLVPVARKIKGKAYHDDIEGAKYYLDYPRADFDVGFEGFLRSVKDIIGFVRSKAKDTPSSKHAESRDIFEAEMVENAVKKIYALFKDRYGVDDVVGTGIDQTKHPNLPFEVTKLGNNIADIFSKRGVQYKVRGQPQHEGDQVMAGGYNHNEIVFSFEPGKMRKGEKKYTPGHSFNLGKDAEGGFVHARISDRIDEAGRKILFVEEIQSDMHQSVHHGGQSYAPRKDRITPKNTELEELVALNKDAKKALKNINKNLEKAQASETRGRTPEEITMRQDLIDDLQVSRDSYIKEIEEQDKIIKDLKKDTGGEGGVTEGPFKNSKDYAKFVIKYLLKMARENGYDGVGVANAWIKTRKMSGQSGSDFQGHFGFYGNWGLPDPSVPASFKEVILKDAMGEVARDSKARLSLTAIKEHAEGSRVDKPSQGRTWADVPVLLITKGKAKEPITEAVEQIDIGQSAYYKGGLVREVFKEVAPPLV